MDGLMDGWNPPNIWIKIIQIVIQIECLHGTNFSIQIAIYLILDNFAPCKLTAYFKQTTDLSLVKPDGVH